MKTRLFFMFLCLILIAPACQSSDDNYECDDAIGCVEIGPREPLKLGILQTLSGGSAPGGTEQVQTAQLVIDQRGGVFLGHPIELQIEDDRCSAEGGANAVLRILADPQVVAIFGPNCSSAAVTASDLMSQAGLVMISSSNTAPGLTGLGGTPGPHWQPGYFRSIYNDVYAGQAAAVFAFQELGLMRAVSIDDDDIYSASLTLVFKQEFASLGGRIVEDITIDVEQSNFEPVITAIINSGAELVYFPLGQPATSAALVQQIREDPRLENLILITGEGSISDIFIDAVDEAGIGVYMVGPGQINNAAAYALRLEYQQRYNEPPPSFYHTFTSDSVNLLLDTLESVAVQDEDGTLHIGRQALRDALYETTHYEGITGVLSCDSWGDCGIGVLQIVHFDNNTVNVAALEANVVYTYRPNR